MPFATTWVNLEGIMFSEIREKQILYIIYTWNIKNKTNKYNKKDLQTVENKLVVTNGRGQGAVARQGQGIKKYKLLCIK